MSYTRTDFTTVGYKTELESKSLLCKIHELPPPSEGVELYRSVFTFREADLAGNDSLRDIPQNTPVYAEFLPIDLDNAASLEEVWADTKKACAVLNALGAPFFVYYSGNKGFHILVPTESFGFTPNEDNEILKRMAISIAGELPSFDPSIYNKSRIFRCPNSYNKKGNKYKIEVMITDSLEDILKAAESPGKGNPSFKSDIVPAMVQLYKACKVKENRVMEGKVTNSVFNSIFVEVGEGGRNEAAYTVARKLARRGMTEADALSIMAELWNPKYVKPPLTPTELQKVVANAYQKGYNPVEDTGAAIVGENIHVSISEAMNEIKMNPGGFITGHADLDAFTMGFEPETVNTIIGRSGNFKSVLLTDILQRGSYHAKKPALFFSMEMGRRTLVPRIIQAAEGISKKQAIAKINSAEATEEFEKTLEAYKYLKLIFRSDLTTESMLAIIDKHMEQFGELSAIGIDYLSLFRGCNSNTERTARQMQDLKGVIAKQARCPIICIAQAKQVYEGREGDIELDRSSPGDTDSILRLSDNCFGLWGHWQNDGTGDRKEIYGRFFKARGFDEELFGPDPYFHMALDKPRMRVVSFAHCPTVPTFRQASGRVE